MEGYDNANIKKCKILVNPEFITVILKYTYKKLLHPL